ncbi:MAG: hypothetical protein FWG37_02835, partial [Clostridia bacterium]|nr:hypothetical protein [Clostridia bacterium]
HMPVPLGVIADACKLNPSTCSHLIDTLCEGTYLEKVSRKDGYILGPMAFSISTQRHYRKELTEAALPVMRCLSGTLFEDSSLSTFSNGKLFVPLTVFYHDEGIKYMRLKTGKLYQSAAGRLFIANMSQRQRDDLIAGIGFPTPDVWDVGPDHKSMEKTLRDIRKNGVVVADKVADSLSAVSAPVFGDGQMQAAVGVYMESERFHGDHLSECIVLTAQAAERIGQRMKEILANSGKTVRDGADA